MRLPIHRIHNLLYLKALAWLQQDITQLLSTPEGNTEFNQCWAVRLRKERKAIIRKYSCNTWRLIK